MTHAYYHYYVVLTLIARKKAVYLSWLEQSAG